MKESNKQQLEGLLKARSDDMRQSRRARNRRPVADPALERRTAAVQTTGHAPARSCEACGGEITLRRLRAMPRATRCLECQRAVEHAAARS